MISLLPPSTKTITTVNDTQQHSYTSLLTLKNSSRIWHGYLTQANQNNTETSARLIKYLIDHKHWSPFEMVNMCVSIETTRSIAAQILRHRSFSFQEFSQRYAEVTLRPEMPYFRAPDPKNRQNSTDTLSEEVLREADQVAAVALVESYKAYNRLLELGVAKECASEVLPLATPTTLYMNGTIRSWLHYVILGPVTVHKRNTHR
jgi:thymidylate synthase (FAD)